MRSRVEILLLAQRSCRDTLVYECQIWRIESELFDSFENTWYGGKIVEILAGKKTTNLMDDIFAVLRPRQLRA